MRPGTTVSFDPVDYHTVAADSYQRFRTARHEGILAEDSRFLVSIATPFNAVNSFAEYDSQVEIAYAYEQGLRDSVDALQEAIPPSGLAVQWDLPTELATIEGWFPNPYGGAEPIYAATARLADWVHDDAELTFHLCYGDSKFGAHRSWETRRTTKRPRAGGGTSCPVTLRRSSPSQTACPATFSGESMRFRRRRSRPGPNVRTGNR